MNGKITLQLSLVMYVFLCANLFAGKVGVIVNKDLYPSIKSSIDQYIADLKNADGKDVWLEAEKYGPTSNIADLKNDLKQHYDNDQLEGAVFIGDLPIVKYTCADPATGERDSRSTFVCDLYYEDLNGTFGGSNPFTSHSGDKKPEIWVSRITASVLRSYKGFENEAQAVNYYFTKVHKRLTGQDNMARKYVIAGQYENWGGLEAENQGDLDYSKENTVCYRGSCGADWKKEIVAGKEYGFVYSHSSATMHAIGFNATDIVNNEINTRFFNSYACSNGNFATGNMVGLYALAKGGLIAVGSSKTGSMIPGSFRSYNKPLGAGKTFGEAWIAWWTEKGITNQGWHYGMNMQGVGSFKLKPYSTTQINPATVRPSSFDMCYSGSKVQFHIPDLGTGKLYAVKIQLYTMQGRQIKTLINRAVGSGNHSVSLQGADAVQRASGLYLCTMQAEDFIKTISVVVEK